MRISLLKTAWMTSSHLGLAFLLVMGVSCSGGNSSVLYPGGTTSSNDDDDDNGNGLKSLFDGNDIDGLHPLSGGDAGDVVYPKLAFASVDGPSAGHFDGKNYPATSKVDVELDTKTLMYDQTTLRMSCGDQQSECDSETNSKIGKTVYDRVDKDDMSDFIDDGFNNVSYAIFSDSIVNAKGETFRFDKPLPVFSWPSRMPAYKELEAGEKPTWTSTVNGQYQVSVRLSKESSNDTEFVMRIETNIPSDSNSNLYSKFPIPQWAIYTIDTKKRVVTKIISHSPGHNAKYDKSGYTELTHILCTIDKEGDVEEVNYCQ